MNLPLRTRVDLLSDMRGYAVDCRMMFLGDRVRQLARTYEEIVRRFKMFDDSDHLFRSLESSDEIKQFYEIRKSNGVTSVALRDSAFQQTGPTEDLKIDARFRLDSNYYTFPLPLNRMAALGRLLPSLRLNLPEMKIKETLQQQLSPQECDWAMNQLSVLTQKGFITESVLPQNHFRKDTPGSRLTFMGHSSLLVQTSNANLLSDPYLRLDDGLPVHGMDAPRLKLDAIVCSHSHWDHCDLQSFLWFDKDTLLIVPKVAQPTAFNPPVIDALQMLGFRNFKEVELWEPIQIQDIELIPVPFHGEQDEPDAVIDHFTYVLRTNDLCVYAGVDSYRDTFGDMIPVLEKVREKYHPSMAFLPVSKVIYRYEWGGVNGFCRYLDTHLVHQTFQYTASADDAAKWVKTLKPKWVAPYALFNFAPWSTPSQIPEFEKALKQVNLQNALYPFRPFDSLDASDLLREREVRRRALIRWFNVGSKMRRFDRRMQQNRIYRYLRYRGQRAKQTTDHH